MRILAVETATPQGSVSLVGQQGVILESQSGLTTTHATWLQPAIGQLLAAARLTIKDIDGFAVSVGPGSFTGLRIGLSTVKGLSLATGKPVVAVPTLEAMAELAPLGQSLVCPLLDARKKEIYAALYRRQPQGALRLIGDYLVLAPHALAEMIDEKVFFLGNGVDLYGNLLVDRLGPKALLAPERLWHPRAAAVGQLGLHRLAQGQVEDLDELEPLYVRPSEAELKKRGLSGR